MQDLKFDGNTLLEATSDLNKAKHLPKLAVGDTQEMMFIRDDSSPFYMPANERLKLKEDDLENFKFATIQKNNLLKKIFAVENWTDKEVIIVCGKSSL